MEALAAAYWDHIAECLLAGDMETRVWLDTGGEPTGFLWWCDVSGDNPSRLRTLLLRVWHEGPSLKRTREESACSTPS